MTFRVGDSIPLDLPEDLDPRPLALGKALRPRGRSEASSRGLLGLALKWVAPQLLIYPAFLIFWPVSAAFGRIHAALMSRGRRWRRGVLSLALSPLITLPLLSAVQGLVDYAGGEARARGHGHRIGRGRLDPLTRTYVRSSGCVVFGYEPFVEKPYNHAVGLMVRCFGTLRGHHAGAYPSRAEAFAALKQGRPATWDIDRPLEMDAEAFGAWLSERLGIPDLEAPAPYGFRLTFSGYHLDLIDKDPRYLRHWPLRIAERDGLVIFGSERMVFLVSTSSKELFAYYKASP